MKFVLYFLAIAVHHKLYHFISKDMLHFYVMLGVIPYSLIVLYVNMFVGPAKLTPTPEGYIPENHEYHKVGHAHICQQFCNI